MKTPVADLAFAAACEPIAEQIADLVIPIIGEQLFQGQPADRVTTDQEIAVLGALEGEGWWPRVADRTMWVGPVLVCRTS